MLDKIVFVKPGVTVFCVFLLDGYDCKRGLQPLSAAAFLSLI